jgi:hypothetical protein
MRIAIAQARRIGAARKIRFAASGAASRGV